MQKRTRTNTHTHIRGAPLLSIMAWPNKPGSWRGKLEEGTRYACSELS